MGTKRPKIGGHGRPNRLVQELLIERAMRELADNDKRTRRAHRLVTTMGNPRRWVAYERQAGRLLMPEQLTPAQRRRIDQKANRYPILDEVAA